jgi:hypothetical protein
VPETLVNELESAIADLGSRLARVQKYRRGVGPEGDVLRRDTLALGDAARRLHRREALDETEAARLLADARTLDRRFGTLLAAIRTAPEYREAIEAERRGDAATLASRLPSVFAQLETVARVPDLFHPFGCFQRGRLRPPAAMVAALTDMRDAGLPAESDDLSPGADPELPAVILQAEPAPDEPILLRFPATTLPAPVHRLADTEDYLLHAPRVRAPFVVRIATALSDEQLRVELNDADWRAYRAELTAALGTVGFATE